MRYAMALVAALIGSAAAAQEAGEQLMTVAAIEWTVANCGAESVHPAYVGMAAMVINGQHGDAMDGARERMRGMVDDEFDNPQDACASLVESFKDSPILAGN
jgi:hypothetical protein